MQANFWHQKWQINEIGFHLPDANPLLVKYFSKLHLKKGTRVFLPLCGKTLDIAWLLAQGYRVAGAELSAIAIEDLFKSLNLTPSIKTLGGISHYSAANIDIFVGDIFKLSPAMLGAVDAVYDRAALVALPDAIRKLYTAHLQTLTNRETPLNHVPQLLICFEYDQTLHAGPPFSISADEVKQHYQANYDINLLASEDLVGGLKGQTPAIEKVWWLNS
jgi:thiopurine S-methyltransferase